MDCVFFFKTLEFPFKKSDYPRDGLHGANPIHTALYVL